jgi:predicted RNA-binding Zn-ribbon protein involved in translation (DUF1610 family)
MVRKYTRELLEPAVAASTSIAGVLRHLGLAQAGGTQALIARRVREYELDTTHFTGQSTMRGQPSTRRLTASVVLVVRPVGSARVKAPVLRRCLVETGVRYVCSGCGVDPSTVPLTLHVDHVNGDWLDNRPQNLRFLCPNCHALPPNYCVPKGAVAQQAEARDLGSR